MMTATPHFGEAKSLVSCTAESLAIETAGDSVLVPNSLLEEYENIRLRELLAQEDEEENGFSLFSTAPLKKKRPHSVRPILPRSSDAMQYERPILDVPYKSLPCQAHFIRGNCPLGDSCYFYHSVSYAAAYMRHVEPTHPIVLNYRIQKLAYERGHNQFVSDVKDKMNKCNQELAKAKRTKSEILKQHAELQNNFVNATMRVQDLEAENKALRDVIKRLRQQRTDPMIDDEPTALASCRNRNRKPSLGRSRGRRRGGRPRGRGTTLI